MSFNYPYYASYVGSDAAMSATEAGIKHIRNPANAQKYIMSLNRTSSFTSGGGGTAISVNKDMNASGNRQIPASVFPSGNATTPSGTRYYWADWSNDVFDWWGDFYIYDQTGATNYITFGTMNGSDGTFYDETQTHGLKSYKIRHGWVTQGVFKMDITCTDPTWGFTVGHYGNMGSDSSTTGGTNTASNYGFNLYFMWNRQSGSSYELFSVYMIPKLYDTYLNWDWSSTPGIRQGLIGNDNRAVWGQGWITHGFIIYYAKSTNIAANVAYDLTIQDGGNYSAF